MLLSKPNRSEVRSDPHYCKSSLVHYTVNSPPRFHTMNAVENTITSSAFRYVFTRNDPFTSFEIRTKTPTELGLDRFVILLRRKTSSGDGGVQINFSHQVAQVALHQ